MKLKFILTALLFAINFCFAQDPAFIQQWFLGFPVVGNLSANIRYGTAHFDAKKISVRTEERTVFFIESLNLKKSFAPGHPFLLAAFDSTTVEISTSRINKTLLNKSRKHYSGKTKIVSVEFFLSSGDSIRLWVNRIIEDALAFKHQSDSVHKEEDSGRYMFGEINYIDDRKRFLSLTIYENVYASGKTSLLVSHESSEQEMK